MKTDPNIPDPDGFYAALIAAHEGLSEAQSAELNARLVFLLANQVGDQKTLIECVEAARQTVDRLLAQVRRPQLRAGLEGTQAVRHIYQRSG